MATASYISFIVFLTFLSSRLGILGTRLQTRPFGQVLPHALFKAVPPKEEFNLLENGNTDNPVEIARNFVEQVLGHRTFAIKFSYTTDTTGVTHVHFRQKINELEVVNGDINVNVAANGEIISYGDSFWRDHAGKTSETDSEDQDFINESGDSVDSGLWVTFKRELNRFGQLVFSQSRTISRPLHHILLGHLRPHEVEQGPRNIIDAKQALAALMSHLNVELRNIDKIQVGHHTSLASGQPELLLYGVQEAVSPVIARQAWIQTGTDLKHVWDVEMEMVDNWFHAQIDSTTRDVWQLVDWVSDADYLVFPLGVNDPNESDQVLITDPARLQDASPYGWHSQYDGRKNYTVTIGNNVYAQENWGGLYEWQNNHRPEGGQNLSFSFRADLTIDPKKYVDAAITNLFYWNNILHDLYYQYGFDEGAGNFQMDNFGRGGNGGDAVIANAQDGSGYNNANFATPPDGRHGRMRMYVWNVADPFRDGDLESGIIVHEYTHGVTIRLTGGPANSGCLGWGESGGMGEGWGDFVATILRMRPEDHRNITEFAMGEYANGGQGIRRYKYSTSMETNPETYGIMDDHNYWGVHAKGEVWAEMLYEVYWNLVDAYGFTPDWFSASLKYGNTLALQLVINGLKLQPCRPLFVDARDAILQADQLLTGGSNQCLIWRGFAKRGLGVGAKLVGGTPWGGGERHESFVIPPECKEGEDVFLD